MQSSMFSFTLLIACTTSDVAVRWLSSSVLDAVKHFIVVSSLLFLCSLINISSLPPLFNTTTNNVPHRGQFGIPHQGQLGANSSMKNIFQTNKQPYRNLQLDIIFCP